MSLTEELINACFNGDVQQAENLINSGVSPNVNGENWNPLHAAIENMQVEVIKFLVKIGADPNAKISGMTPLHHALDIEMDYATQGLGDDFPNPTITKILLDAGANTNETDNYGRTPIEMAKERNHKKAINLLQ